MLYYFSTDYQLWLICLNESNLHYLKFKKIFFCKKQNLPVHQTHQAPFPVVEIMKWNKEAHWLLPVTLSFTHIITWNLPFYCELPVSIASDRQTFVVIKKYLGWAAVKTFSEKVLQRQLGRWLIPVNIPTISCFEFLWAHQWFWKQCSRYVYAFLRIVYCARSFCEASTLLQRSITLGIA